MVCKTLIPGANHPLPLSAVEVKVSLAPPMISGIEVDISAFLLDSNGKVRGDTDMVFFGQLSSGNSAVVLADNSQGESSFKLNLPAIETEIQKVAFTATIYDNLTQFSAFSSITLGVFDANSEAYLSAVFDTQYMSEAALILGEAYRYQGQWKFRAIGQGFIGGLQPLAEHFGVEITPEENSPAIDAIPETAIPPSGPITVAPVSQAICLSATRPVVSLDPRPTGFGEIRLGFTWQQTATKRPFGAIFSANNSPTQLSLACIYQLQNGQTGLIDSQHSASNDYQVAPYITLALTTEQSRENNSQTLLINGQQWSAIKRLLIVISAADRKIDWSSIQGCLSLTVAHEAPLEIILNEAGKSATLCVMMSLNNIASAFQVQREMRYFKNLTKVNEYYC